MIYLTNGNTPLNEAYNDEIVQEHNNTYQLTFRFPTSDPKWELLKEETFLTADDLHGEQDFVIFEVEKKHGYIQVYANQVFTLLNNYVVNPISLDRQTGSTALSRFAGSITRDNPFSFFSDIEDRHTFNIGSKNAMEAFAKDKHSILGQWGGDLVRHGYQVRLLKNGGSENESLFMYKKNLSSYQHKTSTKSLKTRITFKTTVKGEGEKPVDKHYKVVVDSPLINKYSQIYEDVVEVNDQDVVDEATLLKYGKQYFRTTLCDMLEDSLELEVVGQSDVPVQMFDIVSIFHEHYNLDVRKKITKYTYSPMAKKLKSIGFGQFQSGLANAIGNAVSDAVKGEAQQLQDDFERQLARELKNADLAFDRQKEELVNQFTDGLNAAKARAEEVKRQLSDTIDQRFSSFNNGPLQEAKRRAEEALRNAGASSLLAQEAKRIGLDSVARLEAFKSQTTSAQTALSGDLDVLKRTLANDIRPKQAKAEAEIAKQVEALNKTKNELAGVKSAQATYEETTTRRLSELTNLANGKASKSELTQTAEELKSKIASMQVGGRNYIRNGQFKNGSKNWLEYQSVDFGLNFNYQHSQNPNNRNRPGLHFYHDSQDVANYFGIQQSFEFDGARSEKVSVSLLVSKDGGDSNSGLKVALHYIKNKNIIGQEWQNIPSQQITSKYKRFTFTFTLSDDVENLNLMLYGEKGKTINLYVTDVQLERGSVATDYKEAPEDTDEVIRTVQTQLAGSWAVQNINGVGSIVSQINATNNQILIEAEKIRLKGKTLLDELTAIQGYFKRLFVGDASVGTLNSDIIRSNSITADKLVMDMAMARRFVSSDIFTDTLAAKEAFINKLRSVVVTATLLEGFQGLIGGFRFGQYTNRNGYFITGTNSVSVGMGNGMNAGANRNAFWANWGESLDTPGPKAWYVNTDGKMYCRNEATFHSKVDFSSISNPNFYSKIKAHKGVWVGTDDVNGEGDNPAGGYNAVVWWSQIVTGKFRQHAGITTGSDRKLKENIEPTPVKALDKINALNLVAFDYIKDKTHEEIGLIAQEVLNIIPSSVEKYEDEDNHLTINYSKFVPYLIKAIQELNQKIEKMEKTIS